MAAEAPRTVIVISLDGTRPSDLDDTELVTLRALRGLGAVAERLQPEFPTNTFPSHMTLVTGVAPEVHGIVNNVFDDPEAGVFRYENDPSWSEVEPIWAIAARNGVVSAAYYWVGSEGPWRNGFGPRHWESFSNRTSESKKVEQILAWLDLEDPAERPRLITSWFHGADGAGHEHGPGSGPVRDALRRQDRALATLVDGIAARGGFDAVTLLLVSDHGMALVERHLDLKAEFHRAGLEAKVLGGGGVALVSLRGGPAAVDRAVSIATSLGLSAVRPGSRDSTLRLGNPRFGDLVVIAPVGIAITSGSTLRGSHGYLPDEPAMGGLLIAVGRGISAGSRLGIVRALDVAPTVLAWLGIVRPEWMEGRPIVGLASESVLPAPRRRRPALENEDDR
jgi:arylsulfatase A-like enzyme